MYAAGRTKNCPLAEFIYIHTHAFSSSIVSLPRIFRPQSLSLYMAAKPCSPSFCASMYAPDFPPDSNRKCFIPFTKSPQSHDSIRPLNHVHIVHAQYHFPICKIFCKLLHQPNHMFMHDRNLMKPMILWTQGKNERMDDSDGQSDKW